MFDLLPDEVMLKEVANLMVTNRRVVASETSGWLRRRTAQAWIPLENIDSINRLLKRLPCSHTSRSRAAPASPPTATRAAGYSLFVTRRACARQAMARSSRRLSGSAGPTCVP